MEYEEEDGEGSRSMTHLFCGKHESPWQWDTRRAPRG